MEENNDLIIKLIRADLKYNELLSGLSSIHFESDLYCLNLVDMVAKLMDVKGDTSDQWFKVYLNYIDQAYKYEVEDRGDNLFPIAEKC